MDGLTRVRAHFLSLTSAVAILFFSLYSITSEEPATPNRFQWFWIVILGLGAFALFGSVRLRRSKRILHNEPKNAAIAYVGIFFTSVGYAISPALVGMVGVYLTGDFSLYLLGVAFTVPCVFLVAPTRADIERRQEQLNERGASFSLGEAVMAHRDWRRR